MTPQQANDYSFLPEHPMPIPGSRKSDFHSDKPDLSPIAVAVVALIIVGAILYASFYTGRMSARRVDEAKVDQAFKTGLALGAICKEQPTLAACSPESLRAGGVL